MEGFRGFLGLCAFSKRRGELQFALTSVNLWQDLSGLCLDAWELCGKIQCNQPNPIHLRYCLFSH